MTDGTPITEGPASLQYTLWWLILAARAEHPGCQHIHLTVHDVQADQPNIVALDIH